MKKKHTIINKTQEFSYKYDKLQKQIDVYLVTKCNIGEQYRCSFYRHYSEDLCENWCNAYNDYCSVCYNLECLYYKGREDKGERK